MGSYPLLRKTECRTERTPAHHQTRVSNRQAVRPTNAIAPPPELCGEEAAWLENLLDAADDADRIPFTPVQNGGAEDLIEPPMLGQKLGGEFVVEGLDILDVGAFQPVFLSLVDLWLPMRNRRSAASNWEKSMAPTMLWLESTPTIIPTSVTTFESWRVTWPLPQPKSIILSPSLGSRRARTGAVFSVEYTNDAVLLYSDADQVSITLALMFVHQGSEFSGNTV